MAGPMGAKGTSEIETTPFFLCGHFAPHACSTVYAWFTLLSVKWSLLLNHNVNNNNINGSLYFLNVCSVQALF